MRFSRTRYGPAMTGRCSFCPAPLAAQAPARPFGTLREQADLQQRWLEQRMTPCCPALMRKYGVDMWVVPMREYNEDPVFSLDRLADDLRRAPPHHLLFFDSRRARGDGASSGSRSAARRRAACSRRCARTKPVAGAAGVGGTRRPSCGATSSGRCSRRRSRSGTPRSIAHRHVARLRVRRRPLVRRARRDERGARARSGPRGSSPPRGWRVDLIATRLPEEEALLRADDRSWSGTSSTTMFSNALITPGVTRTEDLVWWMRQRVNDLGLGTWFQPSVEVQRKGVTDAQLGDNPVIQRGDVLHCDFGITALRLNTDTQHMGYVLQPGETDAPAGLRKALRTPTAAGHRVRRDRAGADRQRDARRRARQDGRRRASTARSTPIRSACTGTAPGR